MTRLVLDLRAGRWQDTLQSEQVDAVICDPPYGAVVHDAPRAATFDGKARRGLDYDCLSPADIHEFVAFWSPRCSGWMAAMTSDDLIGHWREAYQRAGRYHFAPVPIVQHRPRLTGDGPGSCAVYLMVARPKNREFATWGSLPGWYHADVERHGRYGGKPLPLMRAIVADYSRAGNIVCDPFAGHGTTLLAAHMLGRNALGAEADPAVAARAEARLAAHTGQSDLFGYS